jgi:hypothetical protein
MKFWVGVFTTLLVVAPTPVIVTHYETVVKEVEVQPERVDTPILDSLLTDEDWERIDRESDCLFEFLQLHVGWDITLDAVLAGGYWTDTLGGACLVMEGINGSQLEEVNTEDTP